MDLIDLHKRLESLAADLSAVAKQCRDQGNREAVQDAAENIRMAQFCLRDVSLDDEIKD